MSTPRKYLPHRHKYGWTLAYVEESHGDALWIMPTAYHNTLEDCLTEAEHLNREQIVQANAQLAAAQKNWADVQRLLCGKRLMG